MQFEKALYEERLDEIANLSPKKTGLPMNIYVSDKTGVQHGPRIKVQTDHAQDFRKSNLSSVSITDSPEIVAGDTLDRKDFIAIQDFILRNKQALLDYWDLKIDIADLIRLLT